jgi:hypothetical protein
LYARNADSVTINPENGKRYFVKPLEELEPFGEFLSYIQDQEKVPCKGNGEVKYAQTRMSTYGPLNMLWKGTPWSFLSTGRIPEGRDAYIKWN